MVYVSYGDANFFDRGRLADSDHSDTEFRILFCDQLPEVNEDGEELFRFGHATVDITNTWIDTDMICSVNGQTMDFYKENPIQFALDVLEQYPDDCVDAAYSYDWHSVTKSEILRELQDYVIDSDSIQIEGYRDGKYTYA